jgi:hypothetical protein
MRCKVITPAAHTTTVNFGRPKEHQRKPNALVGRYAVEEF